jgi:hypothetical protein
MGSSSLDNVSRPVIELVTTTRTYVLCPASLDSPPPVSAAAAPGPSLYGKPLYLFGWPFPVPHLDGAVMSSPDREGDDEHAVAISQSEAQAAAQKLLSTVDAEPVRAPRARARRAPRAAPALDPHRTHTRALAAPPRPPPPSAPSVRRVARHVRHRAAQREEHTALPRDAARGQHAVVAAAPAAPRDADGDCDCER